MKYSFFIFIIFLLSAPLFCFAKTEVGIGLVEISFNDRNVLEFYSEPNALRPEKRIKFFNDPTINSWSIKNLEKEKVWLNPEVLWLDYHSFVFRCTSRRNGWYQVIVNNETGKSFWIKQRSDIGFKIWGKFLKEMFGIKRLTSQKIRQSPRADSRAIKYQGGDCFQVRRLSGDWIEIFSPDYCQSGYTDAKSPVKSGWIKWRSGNNLLIEYFITS